MSVGRPDFEFYETPQTFGRYLFRTVPISGTIFEPAVGTGAILRAAGWSSRYRWVTNDLDRRHAASIHQDAATRACWEAASENEPIDWVVSNPPFSPVVEILTLALEYARVGVALHVRMSLNEVLKRGPRRTLLRQFPPSGILFLPRFAYQRSRSTGKWGADDMAACWLVWFKDPTRQKFIDYAPEWVLEAIKAETPAYRARMDALAQFRPPAVVETPDPVTAMPVER